MPETTLRDVRFKRGMLALLVVYAGALVIGTHIPQPPHLVHESDKVIHFAAYFGLAWLAAVNARLRWRLTMRHYLALAALLIALAGLDELTQPPFGRASDPADWLADSLGVLAGLAAARWLPFGRRREA